jgi:hypothetical protein
MLGLPERLLKVDVISPFSSYSLSFLSGIEMQWLVQ